MTRAGVVVYYSDQRIRLSLRHDCQRCIGAVYAIFGRAPSRLDEQGARRVVTADHDAPIVRLGPRIWALRATASLHTRRQESLFAALFYGEDGLGNIVRLIPPREYDDAW